MSHIIRPAGAPDLPFVGHSYVEGVCHADPWSACEPRWMRAAARAVVDRLIRRSEVLVACADEDEAQLFGCVMGSRDPRWLHWIYVKATPDFRRLGIATSLMSALYGDFREPIHYATRTSAIPHYHDRWNLIYSPSVMTDATR